MHLPAATATASAATRRLQRETGKRAADQQDRLGSELRCAEFERFFHAQEETTSTQERNSTWLCAGLSWAKPTPSRSICQSGNCFSLDFRYDLFSGDAHIVQFGLGVISGLGDVNTGAGPGTRPDSQGLTLKASWCAMLGLQAPVLVSE